jgi:ABC-type branched-subunit amino acid transport system ATPase component
MSQGDVILGARGLVQDFAALLVLKRTNLMAKCGTMHKKPGANGAGKLIAFLPPTRRIARKGQDTFALAPADEARLCPLRCWQNSPDSPHPSMLGGVPSAPRRSEDRLNNARPSRHGPAFIAGGAAGMSCSGSDVQWASMGVGHA